MNVVRSLDLFGAGNAPYERISFIESKSVDHDRVSALLRDCARENMWANRGPVYRRLAESYADYLGLGADVAVIPCANAGIALEALARHLDLAAGRRHRWVGSAYSFCNLGRGYFAEMVFVDCDETGVISVEALRALDPASYDGIVVTNPGGIVSDIPEVIAFARAAGKELLIDNAAGVHTRIPDWPWQAFSLHHTKAFGVGEGGLALAPKDVSEDVYALLNYGERPADPALWLNNGKVSDIACAFHLDRLERAPAWLPGYFEQRERVAAVAARAGLTGLSPIEGAPATSFASFLAPDPVPAARLGDAVSLVFRKYYPPLAPLPRAQAIFDHVLCIPCHPDISVLTDAEIAADIERVVG